jgi:hypothetical protein
MSFISLSPEWTARGGLLVRGDAARLALRSSTLLLGNSVGLQYGVVIYQPEILIIVSETGGQTARRAIRNAIAMPFLREFGPFRARGLSQGPALHGSARETLNAVIEARRSLLSGQHGMIAVRIAARTACPPIRTNQQVPFDDQTFQTHPVYRRRR